jgi:AraC family transcriptional regulator
MLLVTNRPTSSEARGNRCDPASATLREHGRAFPRWYIDAVVRTEVGVAREQSLRKKPLLTPPDHLRKFYGANLAEVFRTPLYDCSLKNVCGVPDFALTRLKGGPMEMQRAPAYPEDRAILICVALAPTPVDRWRARIAGREVGVSHSIAFATTVIDLMKPVEMWAAGPFDYLHYYVSRDLLDRVATDNRIAPVDSFRMVFFERDLVVAQLTKTILSQVRNREPLNMLALEDVSLLVSTHLLQHYGNGKGVLRAQPSLEIWQKIRTEEMLRAHLEGEIRIADLATACQLSPSHFSRCFRQSFGTSVHQWLIKLRIDTAKNLLRESELTLAEVGFRSGFCDQAAFTRAFTTLEGTTPFRWRKLNGRTPVATDPVVSGELRPR